MFNTIKAGVRRRKKMMADLEPTNAQDLRQRVNTQAQTNISESIRRKMAERARGVR